MNRQCIRCKGRNLCGRKFCPIQYKIASQKRVNVSLKKDYFGESPNIFIGRFGYPDINVGILNVENYTQHDEPLLWAKNNVQIPQIIDYRTQMVNSVFKANIKKFDDRFLEMSQEISMALKPVDVEINLEKKPQFKLSLNQDTMPHGPNVKLKKAQLTENPKIPTKVEKIVNDDIKAADALKSLYKKNNEMFNEHYLTKLISVGNLGLKKNKRLVPTRFSITAVDSIIGNHLVTEVKNHNIGEYSSYFGGEWGNYYLFLFFPEIWSYELFETYIGSNINYENKKEKFYSTDYEPYDGRKRYADECAGGFYSVRMAILEKMNKLKRQYSCLAFRFITSEYTAPLGVWITRESSRKALNKKAITFSMKELILKYAKFLIQREFNFNLDILLNKSIILKKLKQQTKLAQFI